MPSIQILTITTFHDINIQKDEMAACVHPFLVRIDTHRLLTRGCCNIVARRPFQASSSLKRLDLLDGHGSYRVLEVERDVEGALTMMRGGWQSTDEEVSWCTYTWLKVDPKKWFKTKECLEFMKKIGAKL
jgi:hypothetical protein